MSGFEIPHDYARMRSLRSHAEATELVSIGAGAGGREVRLTPKAAAAWTRMAGAASRAGVAPVALSGFRSIERQSEIISSKIAAGETLESILTAVAAPGYSEHHTGRAIDVGAHGEEPLTEAFAESAVFKWLEANAASYGFTLSYPRGNPHGIVYEPWHWCFHDE